MVTVYSFRIGRILLHCQLLYCLKLYDMMHTLHHPIYARRIFMLGQPVVTMLGQPAITMLGQPAVSMLGQPAVTEFVPDQSSFVDL